MAVMRVVRDIATNKGLRGGCLTGEAKYDDWALIEQTMLAEKQRREEGE
tara:strand:+ start:3039 stop:3185 length:147 start_codon:yes stop_codon:yes gene_type:complete